MITDRDPGWRLFKGIRALYSGESNSCTIPARLGVHGTVWHSSVLTSSKKPNNPRRAFECAEHDGESAVLSYMRNRLYALENINIGKTERTTRS